MNNNTLTYTGRKPLEECTIAPNTDTIFFNRDGRELLRITEKGFEYMGKVIDDAGEAHRLFVDVMNQMREAMLHPKAG